MKLYCCDVVFLVCVCVERVSGEWNKEWMCTTSSIRLKDAGTVPASFKPI